jgi:AcrR family transcriptional regulator
VNDCLYPAAERSVNDRDRLVAIFLDAFDGQPDLDDLSPAARRVLATAAALFHERGAVDTSVRDVTKACGLTPAALYNHFTSKDDLLFALVRHGHERMQRRVDRSVSAAARDPEAVFRAFVRAYVSGHVEQPELAQVVRREYLHLSPRYYAKIVAMRRAFRRQLTKVLLAGQRAGVFTLIDGEAGAVAQTLMVLDLGSRTSDWFDPSRQGHSATVLNRYERAALRLVGAISADATGRSAPA